MLLAENLKSIRRARFDYGLPVNGRRIWLAARNGGTDAVSFMGYCVGKRTV